MQVELGSLHGAPGLASCLEVIRSQLLNVLWNSRPLRNIFLYVDSGRVWSDLKQGCFQICQSDRMSPTVAELLVITSSKVVIKTASSSVIQTGSNIVTAFCVSRSGNSYLSFRLCICFCLIVYSRQVQLYGRIQVRGRHGRIQVRDRQGGLTQPAVHYRMQDGIVLLVLSVRAGVEQEVIVVLVEQCRLYRQRVVHLVNSTSDQEMLSKGLALNDDLQNALSKYDAVATDTRKQPKKQKSLQALVDIDDHQDNDNNSDTRSNASNQAPLQQLLLPAPPEANSSHIDLLSGEDFGSPAEIVAFQAEQSYATETYVQQQHLSPHSPYLNGVDQSAAALPPPPWETELVESTQQLSLQPPWEMQVSQQHLGMYLPQSQQGYDLTGSYSQLHGNNMAYYYPNPKDFTKRMYGISMQDSACMNGGPSYTQMPSRSSISYLQQPMRPLKSPEDTLFSDLVSMAKSKPNRPTNLNQKDEGL